MRKTSYLIGALLVVSLVLTALTYVGRETPTAPAREIPTITDNALPGGAVEGLSTAPGRPQLAELERLIRAFGEQTTRSPNAAGFAFLGKLELERARLTGDVAGYARADAALTRAVELAPEDPEAHALLASVRFTSHDFLGAFELASETYERTGDLGALAVRADAALELGRYDRATADYQVLASVAPAASTTLVRLARLAFLQGDPREAARLAGAAEDASAAEGATGTTRSWYATFRGRLALDAGDYGEAARHYRRALDLAPEYHVGLAGLAAARAAQGRLDAAIVLYERAASAVPEPATLAALGDAYAALGDERTAADRYATVEAIATLAEADARLYDRQLALFRADHGGDLEQALRVVQEGLEVRRDVYGEDALAWVLYRLGRFDEARDASERALALGTQDARLWFHAGMISAALGEHDRARGELARALEISPSFDPLLAPIARARLEGLGG